MTGSGGVDGAGGAPAAGRGGRGSPSPAAAERSDSRTMRSRDDERVPRPRAPLRLDETILRVAGELDAAGVALGHGTAEPVDEAAWLVLHAIGLSPVEPPDHARVLGARELAAVDALVARRVDERRPTAYLTGRAWFAGHELLCDERALVPRSPLAELVAEGFLGLVPTDRDVAVLDLCTGGGCIAIACAHALPRARVDASDLSAEALSLAAENVRLHGLEDRVRLLRGSLYEPVRGPYDLVVSNPPYVDAADLAAMPEEYRHEPPMGLGAGKDGLALVRDILAGAADVLAPEGVLVVEVGNSAPALERAFPELDFAWIEFAHGGDGVFALDRAALAARFG